VPSTPTPPCRRKEKGTEKEAALGTTDSYRDARMDAHDESTKCTLCAAARSGATMRAHTPAHRTEAATYAIAISTVSHISLCVYRKISMRARVRTHLCGAHARARASHMCIVCSHGARIIVLHRSPLTVLVRFLFAFSPPLAPLALCCALRALPFVRPSYRREMSRVDTRDRAKSHFNQKTRENANQRFFLRKWRRFVVRRTDNISARKNEKTCLFFFFSLAEDGRFRLNFVRIDSSFSAITEKSSYSEIATSWAIISILSFLS